MRNLVRLNDEDFLNPPEKVYFFGRAYGPGDRYGLGPNIPGRIVEIIEAKAYYHVKFKTNGVEYQTRDRSKFYKKLVQAKEPVAAPVIDKVKEGLDNIQLCLYKKRTKEDYGTVLRDTGVKGKIPSGGVACIAFVLEDGVHFFHTNTACHAGMRLDCRISAGKNVVYIVSEIIKDKLEKSDKAYYTWLFNHSPYAECFITKNVDGAYNYGIVLDANTESSLLVGAAIATRIPTEWESRCNLWYEMVRNGINPVFAFFFIHSYDLHNNNLNMSAYCGHMPLCSGDPISTVKRKMNGDSFRNKSEIYSEFKRYGNINSVFDEGRRVNGGFLKLCQDKSKSLMTTRDGSSKVNPFAREEVPLVPLSKIHELCSTIINSEEWRNA